MVHSRWAIDMISMENNCFPSATLHNSPETQLSLTDKLFSPIGWHNFGRHFLCQSSALVEFGSVLFSSRVYVNSYLKLFYFV